jgi:hypothetical protein
MWVVDALPGLSHAAIRPRERLVGICYGALRDLGMHMKCIDRYERGCYGFE